MNVYKEIICSKEIFIVLSIIIVHDSIVGRLITYHMDSSTKSTINYQIQIC